MITLDGIYKLRADSFTEINKNFIEYLDSDQFEVDYFRINSHYGHLYYSISENKITNILTVGDSIYRTVVIKNNNLERQKQAFLNSFNRINNEFTEIKKDSTKAERVVEGIWPSFILFDEQFDAFINKTIERLIIYEKGIEMVNINKLDKSYFLERNELIDVGKYYIDDIDTEIIYKLALFQPEDFLKLIMNKNMFLIKDRRRNKTEIDVKNNLLIIKLLFQLKDKVYTKPYINKIIKDHISILSYMDESDMVINGIHYLTQSSSKLYKVYSEEVVKIILKSYKLSDFKTIPNLKLENIYKSEDLVVVLKDETKLSVYKQLISYSKIINIIFLYSNSGFIFNEFYIREDMNRYKGENITIYSDKETINDLNDIKLILKKSMIGDYEFKSVGRQYNLLTNIIKELNILPENNIEQGIHIYENKKTS